MESSIEFESIYGDELSPKTFNAEVPVEEALLVKRIPTECHVNLISLAWALFQHIWDTIREDVVTSFHAQEYKRITSSYQKP